MRKMPPGAHQKNLFAEARDPYLTVDPDVDVEAFAHHVLVQHWPGVPLPKVDAAHVLLHDLLDQLAQGLIHDGRAAAGDGSHR